MFFKLSLFLQLALQIVRIGHFYVLSAAIPSRKGLKGGFGRPPSEKEQVWTTPENSPTGKKNQISAHTHFGKNKKRKPYAEKQTPTHHFKSLQGEPSKKKRNKDKRKTFIVNNNMFVISRTQKCVFEILYT